MLHPMEDFGILTQSPSQKCRTAKGFFSPSRNDRQEQPFSEFLCGLATLREYFPKYFW
jgi:hypothetical protein